jgi:hypothetical protein
VAQNNSELKLLESNPTKPDFALRRRNMLLLGLFCLVVILIAEYFNSNYSHLAGIIAYFIVLFGVITTGSVTGDKPQREFWLALGIVPIIRLVSIAMPVMLQISQFIWYIIIAIPIFACVFYLTRFFKYDLADVGLTWNYPGVQILVGITGIGLAMVDYFILKPTSLISSLSIQLVYFLPLC